MGGSHSQPQNSTMCGFADSSSNVSCNNGTLHAVCRKLNGTNCEQILDLNKYIGNEDGNLIRKHDGDFARSCQNIKIDSAGLLTCMAKKKDGTLVPAELKLNDYIGNVDGQLKYEEIQRPVVG
ncbi:unnamed protein product [Didymodactylos carnosus]|uniref:Cyanovirin-N domain-containing protein n=1 Tax=Didymodactylos carnosus TaxID=1234261 RepID=A0A814B8Z6_9BILA|nr:unnamed protein product [Didymodactylos carnosus]CAF0922722.1 unnamed protein product [Didymodactylos carnosus]CAF3537759.1 unnamed protein product [Didymodactylos carnosus]CAF3701800.1 unnamed protein product [Didymodactylos carnosus]